MDGLWSCLVICQETHCIAQGTHYSVMTYMRKESRVYICICVTDSLCYAEETHILNQLYFNIYIFFKTVVVLLLKTSFFFFFLIQCDEILFLQSAAEILLMENCIYFGKYLKYLSDLSDQNRKSRV